jgi:predicted small lipoprotein YifL
MADRMKKEKSLLVFAACLAALAPSLAACGSKPLALPEQPVDRAATCGVVAAAEARLAVTDVKSPLPLAAHGRIVDHALLAASEGGEYDPETANAVSRRMLAIQDRVTGGDWQALSPACKAAYPVAEKTDIVLPEERFAAQLQCNELAQFLGKALAAQESDYRNELASWRHLHDRLNDAIAPGLTAKAGPDLKAQLKARHKALAEASRLGAPTAIMARCLERFP